MHKREKSLFFVVLPLLLLLIFQVIDLFDKNQEIAATESSSSPLETTASSETLAAAGKALNKNTPQQVLLDVPLISQLEEPSYYNGCEITSLAMLLAYFDYDVSKTELAEALRTVPYVDDNGLYGDPNVGFVGDITGAEAGFFVYSKPIFNLTKEYVSGTHKAVHLTGADFSDIESYLADGSPVWVITTTSFTDTDDVVKWRTASGSVDVSMSEHAVVLTGYDAESVYLNDPYGTKDYQTDKADFIESWEMLGQQAVTIK